jgi:branched-chain amino acid transport system ATP-binding protein
MANQYEVLGKAPGPEELKKLSPKENHVTIKKMSFYLRVYKYFLWSN